MEGMQHIHRGEEVQAGGSAGAVTGEIVGRPTLLATYNGRIDAQSILDRLGQTGYSLEDVSVYYRPQGTDQVIDAVTGQVAAGQSLNEGELKRDTLEKVDTLVLMHPDHTQFPAVQQALISAGGSPDIKYSETTHASSDLEGVKRYEAPVED